MASTIKSIEEEQDINVVYQLDLRASLLAYVCLIWQDKVHLVIPQKAMYLSWGPTLEDLAHVRKMEMVADQNSDSETVIAVNNDDDNDDDGDEEEEEEDGEEQKLSEVFELLALSVEFHSSYNGQDEKFSP